MNCPYCRSSNAEDEHRCTRCGRRLRGTVAVASAAPAVTGTSGSRAAAARAVKRQAVDKAQRENVIPFDAIPRRPLAPPTAVPLPSAPLVVPQKAPARKRPAPHANGQQAALDFLVAPPPGPRTLKTSVEAQIVCDAPVATPRHRAIAASLDAAVVAAGFVLFLFTFRLVGGAFPVNRWSLPWYAAAFAAMMLFYGILWALAGRETAGMRWSGLRLVDFDGHAPDRLARFLRFAGTCVSLAAGGMGLAWALFDEEQLAWNDHMSKTFPTFQESNSNFFRKR